ncbi:MAG: ABC transporter substrate-binding protein [Polyangiaceae bacterium]|nr:ABC transporter substrate-binding protein [Polyangiaceae bacterium]
MKTFLTTAALALFLSVAGSALAGPATDVVKSKQTALFDLIGKPSSPDNDKKIAAIFDEMIDYGTLAEASLGTEWAARTDAEKKEFTDLLKQLVRKAYEKNLKKTLNYNIEYVSEEQKDGAYVVKTKAKSKTDAREEAIEIAYKMAQKDGKWRMQDVTTEGVSLVSSYKSQFTKIIKKDGFATLITKMKDKIAKGDV